MKNQIVKFLKGLIFTPAYIRLYPLSKKEGIIEKINNYDYTLADEFTQDIDSLLRYLFSEIESNKIEMKKNTRNLERTYKIKKIKRKDKETKIKTVEEVKIEKKRIIDKEDRANYTKRNYEIKKSSSLIEDIADRLTEGTLIESDLAELDRILKHNRIRTSTYIVGIAVTVLIVALIIIF